MNQLISGKKVAVLVTDGFEQIELTSPREALIAAGAEAPIVSPKPKTVRGWQHTEWGDSFDVDIQLDDARPEEFDALLLPGGVMNPDNLRTYDPALEFVRHFFENGKVVAAICHGPWTLINAGVVKGRTMTSYHTIRADLENAGAKWMDKEVIVDNGLVTSRSPDDLDAFIAKMIEEIGEGRHEPVRPVTTAAHGSR